MSEVWRTVEQYDDYEISSFGQVKSKERYLKIARLKNPRKYGGRMLSPAVCGLYWQVSLYKQGMSCRDVHVHVLVAETFVENPDPENKVWVNHIDGDKFNNHFSNLEWTTPKENAAHAYRTGLRTDIGENNKFHKLKRDQVAFIRALTLLKEFTDKQIASVFGVNLVTVSCIRRNETWKHVEPVKLKVLSITPKRERQSARIF